MQLIEHFTEIKCKLQKQESLLQVEYLRNELNSNAFLIPIIL